MSRFIFVPLKALVDLGGRKVEVCEKIRTGKAIISEEWKGIPRVELIGADSLQITPPFITCESYCMTRGALPVLHVGPRDLWTITAALGEAHRARAGKLPTWKQAERWFYGSCNDALRTMIVTACGIKTDPETGAFSRISYEADPEAWNRIRIAARAQLAREGGW